MKITRSAIIITLLTFVLGGVIGYFIHPKAEIISPDVTKYEYENKIQRLEYENKLAKVETRFLQRLHFIENADSSGLDSLWINYSF